MSLLRIALAGLLVCALFFMCGRKVGPEGPELKAELEGYMLYAWISSVDDTASAFDEAEVYAVLGDKIISMVLHEARYRCLLPWNGDLSQLNVVAKATLGEQEVSLKCRPARKVYLAFGTMR